MTKRVSLEVVKDAAGQELRVGDWVGGVRLQPRPHTVVGRVERLATRECVVKVSWVSPLDGKAHVSAERSRAQVGEETRLRLTRTFRVAQGGLPGTGCSHAEGCRHDPVTCQHGCLWAADQLTLLGAEMVGEEPPDVINVPMQRAAARARELIVRADEIRAEQADVGLTEGAGESVLDRSVVRVRYAAALDRAMPGWDEWEARGPHGGETLREAAWDLADVVLRVRDRELAMLRQRLALDVGELRLDAEEPEASPVVSAVAPSADLKGERRRRFVPWAETKAKMRQARRERVNLSEVNPAEAVSAAVELRRLHWQVIGRHPLILSLKDATWCHACREEWPCTTIRVLDGERGVTAEAGHVEGPTGCRCNEPYPCGRDGEEGHEGGRSESGA